MVDLVSISAGVDTYVCLLQIRNDVTHIVHNAWPVTFTYHFSSFIPQLNGLRAALARASRAGKTTKSSCFAISGIDLVEVDSLSF